jgi:transposase InsO family protein
VPGQRPLQAAFARSGRCYGSRRLQAALRGEGIKLGRYRVRGLMRAHGLRATWKRKFIHTTDSRHSLPTAATCWTGSSTAGPGLGVRHHLSRTRSGWLYLAAVMDLFSRKIVGWAMAPTMPAELVCSALQMAITQRSPSPGLIVHSDRGSQRIQPVVATPSNWRFVWGDPQGGKSR